MKRAPPLDRKILKNILKVMRIFKRRERSAIREKHNLVAKKKAVIKMTNRENKNKKNRKAQQKISNNKNKKTAMILPLKMKKISWNQVTIVFNSQLLNNRETKNPYRNNNKSQRMRMKMTTLTSMSAIKFIFKFQMSSNKIICKLKKLS